MDYIRNLPPMPSASQERAKKRPVKYYPLRLTHSTANGDSMYAQQLEDKPKPERDRDKTKDHQITNDKVEETRLPKIHIRRRTQGRKRKQTLTELSRDAWAQETIGKHRAWATDTANIRSIPFLINRSRHSVDQNQIICSTDNCFMCRLEQSRRQVLHCYSNHSDLYLHYASLIKGRIQRRKMCRADILKATMEMDETNLCRNIRTIIQEEFNRCGSPPPPSPKSSVSSLLSLSGHAPVPSPCDHGRKSARAFTYRDLLNASVNGLVNHEEQYDDPSRRWHGVNDTGLNRDHAQHRLRGRRFQYADGRASRYMQCCFEEVQGTPTAASYFIPKLGLRKKRAIVKDIGKKKLICEIKCLGVKATAPV